MEKEDLTKRIILRDKITCNVGINPLELSLGYRIRNMDKEEYNEKISSSLSYSFE